MRGPSWIVVIVTVVLEIMAFGLAIGAMTRRSTASVQETLTDESCAYTSSVATGLAAGAIILLIAGQAVIMGVTGCLCCGSGTGKGRGRACAIISFALAWLTFAIAEICLIAGARLNKDHTNAHVIFTDNTTLTCKEVRRSVFATAAAFTFLTLLFSELYYLMYVKSSEESWDTYKNGNPTISMTAYP